ncbi:glyoxalase/bleomycin resistance protein/dioxygenase [Westerdykella ornata]|uniref:Glyoxalase/bleomycin resistance protein/dioxygenase n=1 Tax=Westerdykella ornata TaxID=318751 RepID=A0A6A6JR93_WESOR|nr:glyoxalase/bleomycin resistance protein/dioxygenase [Westerdykella ornata]KAF2279161.1 glyoxalase/bleomycin resistance protein/dioxygenase [Westerdykella ornata]
MLDHAGFSVHPSRFEEVVNFYAAALAPLGYTKQKEFPGVAVGFGPSQHSMPFWIAAKEVTAGAAHGHVAFSAKDHETVDRFHAEGIKAGGTCNGKPGLRNNYHPNYYAAFLLDPLGNNIEVVDHLPH